MGWGGSGAATSAANCRSAPRSTGRGLIATAPASMRSRPSSSFKNCETRTPSSRIVSRYSRCFSSGQSWLNRSSEKPTKVAIRLRTSWPRMAIGSGGFCTAQMIRRRATAGVPPFAGIPYARSGVVSQNGQKRDEVGTLPSGQANLEVGVVEVHHVVQTGGRTIVEIGRSRRETAQDRSLELANVGPLAGDERSARIGCLHYLAGRAIAQGVERHVRRTAAGVGDANVERHGRRVIADIGVVVAGSTRAAEHR